MDSEFVKWFATLGVGGVLAAFMFHFYRMDRKDCADRHAEHMKRHETTCQRLEVIVQDNTEAMTTVKDGVAQLTGVVSELKYAIENRQRRFERDGSR
jgi:hypothetical protein